jgi:acyl-CoA thioesterase-1
MWKVLVCAVGVWVAGVAQAATVLVFGDSLSAGYGMDRTAAWPSLLAQKLAQAQSPYTVVNVSVSGETTAGGRARLPAALKEHRPSVVVLELGANDGLRGLPVQDMRANLAAMIEASKASGARVLLVGMQMPPNSGLQYTRNFEAAFQELSKKFKVPLVPFLLEGMADQREFFQADGLHPTAAAQPRLLETVWGKLGPMLKK